MRLVSELIGMDVYSNTGRWLGKVEEVCLDLETKRISTIYLESLSSMWASKNFIKTCFEKSILFKNIKSIGEVIVLKSKKKKVKKKC